LLFTAFTSVSKTCTVHTEREDVSSDAGDGEIGKQDVDSSDVDINAMLEEIEVIIVLT
jgi:hypothetical protein